MPRENRVAATPETVAAMTAKGFDVTVETGAGEGIFIDDQAYVDAGAKIAPGPRELYGGAQLVLKVKEPRFNDVSGAHEAEMMVPGTGLIAFLHPAAPDNHAMVNMLADGGITSFTLDSIPRMPEAEAMDPLISMSTITGYRAVLLAAEKLPRFVPRVQTAAGTNDPARILVVGAGVAGIQSIITAKHLEAEVLAVDIREEARKQAELLGARVVGFFCDEATAQDKQGHARELIDDLLEQERGQIAELIPEADIVITSVLVPGERAPVIITREMVELMKPGSVIVDVGIDQGGNCEVTSGGEEVVFGKVTVIGLKNIPGHMAEDATRLFSRNVLNFLLHLTGDGREDLRIEDPIATETLVTHRNRVVHHGALKAMGRV
jgi:NAD(P) transhydrogenase subunit alpha